jgi:pimeloyl-ACP methyl ester carboxylesterase
MAFSARRGTGACWPSGCRTRAAFWPSTCATTAASPWEDSHTYPDLAADLAEVIAAHGGVADVVGHSMGGKAAMALALGHPDQVRRLVVADIAPVAYGHTQQPMIDAMRAVDLARWSGAAMRMRSLRRWCRRTGCARSFCNRLTWAGNAGA